MPRKTKTQLYIETKRDEWDVRLADIGHTMTWQRDDNHHTWRGECTGCGATISVNEMSTSCWRMPDARNNDCRPAERVINEIEAERFAAYANGLAAEVAAKTTAPWN